MGSEIQPHPPFQNRYQHIDPVIIKAHRGPPGHAVRSTGRQRLELYHDRTVPFQTAPDCRARHLVHSLLQKKPRRIGNLRQAPLLHGKNPTLLRGAETVFQGT